MFGPQYICVRITLKVRCLTATCKMFVTLEHTYGLRHDRRLRNSHCSHRQRYLTARASRVGVYHSTEQELPSFFSLSLRFALFTVSQGIVTLWGFCP